MQETLHRQDHIRIERIVSRGHHPPQHYMYDRAEDELILLLSGSAVLSFEESKKTASMAFGNWMVIPAHQKHRVEATNQDEDTVWLAIFMSKHVFQTTMNVITFMYFYLINNTFMYILYVS